MSFVLTIAQQKGGAGKTTLAAHLAVAFSQRGYRVAAIDIDPQGSLSAWHKERESKLGEGFTGIHFLTMSGWRISTEISRLKKKYDMIIIDSPPHTESEAKTAIRHASMVMLPVQPSPTDLWATQPTIDLAERESLPVMVVLNRVTANAKLASKIAKKLPYLAQSRIGNRVAFASALMDGKCVTETQPASPAAQEMRSLVAEIQLRMDALNPEEAIASEDA